MLLSPAGLDLWCRIVSRLLNRFERAGWVRLSREHIEVLDSAALRAVAAGQMPPA